MPCAIGLIVKRPSTLQAVVESHPMAALHVEALKDDISWKYKFDRNFILAVSNKKIRKESQWNLHETF